MYSAFLMIHNLLRWVVLLLAILVIVRAVLGVTGRREWAGADHAGAQWFGRMLDLQMLLGLVLYIFLSPFMRDAFADFAATMRNPPLRFFAVEHIVGMIAAVALTHIGTARIKKAKDAAQRHKSALIFYALALVVILLSIPWPGTPAGRPLLRGFDSGQNP